MKFITKLKSWQIFLFVGFPFLLPFLIMPLMVILNIASTQIIFVLLLIWMFSYISYLLLLGIALHKIIGFKKNIGYYFFVSSMIYSLLYSVFLVAISGLVPAMINYIDFSNIIIFHLFAMFANINAFRFDAKLISSIEKNKKATLNDYLGDFFLLWFLPFGIWVIQPRINKIGNE